MSHSDLGHDSQTLLCPNHQCTPKRGRSDKKNELESDTADVDGPGDTRVKRVKLRLACGVFPCTLFETAQ